MNVILFLSTGRCGTQFAAEYLQQSGQDAAVVRHEPLGAAYAPRLTLRHPDLAALRTQLSLIDSHLNWVDQVVREQGKTYVETGWPLFPWVPHWFARYGDAVTVVHIVRHPVRFAFSQASHDFYAPERRHDGYTELAALTPADEGVIYKQFAPIWPSLNPVEKSLFQWLEVNTYAEELKLRWPGRWVTLCARDFFAAPQRLIEQLHTVTPSLASVLRPASPPDHVVDRFQRRLRVAVDGVRVPPEVSTLAAHYGFAIDEIDPQILAERFYGVARG